MTPNHSEEFDVCI